MSSTSAPPFAPRRQLGRTGFTATALGIGDLADRRLPIEQCVATARRAIDAGLNIIDTAPGYEDGYSEQIVGQAVKGWRDEMFVIEKIDSPEAPVRAGTGKPAAIAIGSRRCVCISWRFNTRSLEQ